jgi:hypothetical protein
MLVRMPDGKVVNLPECGEEIMTMGEAKLAYLSEMQRRHERIQGYEEDET